MKIALLLFPFFISFIHNDNKVPTFTFHVYSIETELNKVEGNNNYFGSEVAKLESLFEQKYKIQDEEAVILSAGSSYKLRKPELYFIVGKLKRYYKKQIRKDDSKFDELSKKYARVLTIANAVVMSDTEEFKNALKAESEIENISEIFCKTILIYE